MESTKKSIKSLGRKPIYEEERVKIGCRVEKSLADDLTRLVEIKKKDDPKFTQNEYIATVLQEKVSFDLFQLTRKK